MPPVLGMTGATGFVGQAVLSRAIGAGWHVRALARTPQPPREGVTWVSGALNNDRALAQMAHGCGAVMHIAGVVNAHDKAGFEAGNVAGTQAVVAAANTAGVARFIHISSLAARRPALSEYGASKAKAEAIVEASALAWTIVRPPAIYGPGDRDHLELFKMAKRGIVLLPPPGRLSLLHVDDLAQLLLILIGTDGSTREIYEVDDGKPGGWTHQSFAKAIGWAVGRRVAAIAMPKFALLMAAGVDRLLRGSAAKLTRDRVNYFCHPDWVVAPDKGVAAELWSPAIPTRSGLKDVAAAYRAAGWL